MGREIESVPAHAIEALICYDWPGNIRELQNVIERSVILSNGPEFQVAMPEMIGRSSPVALRGPASDVSNAAERAANPPGVEGSQGNSRGAVLQEQIA